jgi:hypothetical protein
MRLTAELIQAAPVYMNPCKQREINLRGAFARGNSKPTCHHLQADEPV